MTNYQVWTYPTTDVYGESDPGISPLFSEEAAAKEWALTHAETSDDYGLVLKIKCGLRPTNRVVFDTRQLLEEG